MKIRRKIPSEIITNLLDASNGTEHDGWRRVANVDGDHGRWRQHKQLILGEGLTFWCYEYEVGLTENCDSTYPHEDWDTVDVYQVKPIPKMGADWIPVAEGEGS